MVEQGHVGNTSKTLFPAQPPRCFRCASTLSSLRPRFWNEPAMERKRRNEEP